MAYPADLGRRHARFLEVLDTLQAEPRDSRSSAWLTQVFEDVLGYRRISQDSEGGWELEAEVRMDADGPSVHGALGFFHRGEPGALRAILALKPLRHDLDRSGCHALTPVQQAWTGAHHAPGCRFLVVSNDQEMRLYSTAHTLDVCETFAFTQMVPLDGFKRFYAFLARERLLGATAVGRSPVEGLFEASAQAEKEASRALSQGYRRLREKLFTQLRLAHPRWPPLDVLERAQTLLDRVLFMAFAEDRDLLPPNTLAEAIAPCSRDPSKSLWDNLQGAFRWIEGRKPAMPFPGAHREVFQLSESIEPLHVADALCQELVTLGESNVRKGLSVEALGHVFEQSIGDLEALGREVKGFEPAKDASSKRHDEGVYYTPSQVTRYMVDRTIGRTLTERREAIFEQFKPAAQQSPKAQAAAARSAWEAYREVLQQFRVLDPSCGSGAFLVAADEALMRESERVHGELAALCEGQVEPFDGNKTVLASKLFGVDVNRASVELTKRSLWLQAASAGRSVSSLDRSIQWGDSIIQDPDVSPVAFDWTRGDLARARRDSPRAPTVTAIDACWREGFDIVLGNPPYLRHERFKHIKEYLRQGPHAYATYHGMADLYVYFFERGLSLLKPHGRLGFIVSNKWLRAGYAAPLRKFLSQRTQIECIVDCNHVSLFEDADAFPCIVVLRKLAQDEVVPDEHTCSVMSFPGAPGAGCAIAGDAARQPVAVPQRRLRGDPWRLEPPALDSLLETIRARGIPLDEFSGTKPYYGIKTGLNQAFLVNDATKNRLCAEDPRSAEILKRYVRGQDIGRWSSPWRGSWMIFARRDISMDAYPAILRHLEGFRAQLAPRPFDWEGAAWPGRKAGIYPWYAIQDAIEYWELFDKPKIIYPDIAWQSGFCVDVSGLVVTNTVYFLPTTDPWLLTVLNSPLMWAYCWRKAVHGKDEALRLYGAFMVSLPIASPDNEARELVEHVVPELVFLVKEEHDARKEMLSSLRSELSVPIPRTKLKAFDCLDRTLFMAEAEKRRTKAAGKLTSAHRKALDALYDTYAHPIQAHRRRVHVLERRLADAVNRAYGLTPDQVALLWATAPPRMPVGPA